MSAVVRSVIAVLSLTSALVFPVVSSGQQQTPAANAAWPCGSRIDPSYFRVAEGTGGHLLLLAPSEIGDAAALLMALQEHAHTIFRLTGALNPGLHEFHVPIDSTVESVVFSISVQCLQAADVFGRRATARPEKR